MTTREFINLLEQHRDQALLFNIGQTIVPAGYHVTEIKAATIHAMDCGGMATSWNETILQVWPPARATDEEPMTISKFLDIYRRVAGSVPVRGDAQVRVEYGAAGDSAISYVVTDIRVTSSGVEVRLVAPAVACKGARRSVGNIPTTVSLETVPGQQDSAACCTTSENGAKASAAGSSAPAACCT